MDRTYKVLFHFENKEIDVLEIKINGVESEDKSKICHWLLFLKDRKELIRLIFDKMIRNGGKNLRYFKDSYLEFDNETAFFTKGERAYKLKNTSLCADLENTLKQEIDKFILTL